MRSSFRETVASAPPAVTSKKKLAVVTAVAVGPLLSLVSLVGPSWLFVPTNPVAHVPAATLDFGVVHDLISAGALPTNGLQEAYFSWLGWTIVAHAIVAAAAFAVAGVHVAELALATVSVAGLALTTFAVKGVLTWGQFFDRIPNVRLGGCLVVIGFAMALLAALTNLVRGNR